MEHQMVLLSNAVADLRGARGTRAPRAQILSISYSFWENLAKSYVGAPLGSWRPPPRGNPGSATTMDINLASD